MLQESSELFVNCLEAMVETSVVFPAEENAPLSPRPPDHGLSSSMSSLTMLSDRGSSSWTAWIRQAIKLLIDQWCIQILNYVYVP